MKGLPIVRYGALTAIDGRGAGPLRAAAPGGGRRRRKRVRRASLRPLGPAPRQLARRAGPRRHVADRAALDGSEPALRPRAVPRRPPGRPGAPPRGARPRLHGALRVARPPGSVFFARLDGRARYHALDVDGRARSALARHALPDDDPLAFAFPGDADYDDAFDWDGPFWTDLKSRVAAALADAGAVGRRRGPRAPKVAKLAAATAVAVVCAYYVYVAWRVPFAGRLVAAVVLAPAYWLGPSCLLHDGAHGSLAPWDRARPNGWRHAANGWAACLGGFHTAPMTWRLQHVVLHHAHTNRLGRDPDLYHFSYHARPGAALSAAFWPGFRFSPGARSWAANRFWRLGVALRAPLATLGPALVWDVPAAAALAGGDARGAKFMALAAFPPATSKLALALHLAGRLAILAIVFLWPCAREAFEALAYARPRVVGADVFARAAALAVLPYALHGLIYYAFSQANHATGACFAADETGDPPRAARSAGRPEEWAAFQAAATQDYGVASPLWLHLSNGLNFHALHHLFPAVDWSWHPLLQPVLERCAADHGVPLPKPLPGLFAALRAHAAHLAKVNDGRDAPPRIPPGLGDGALDALRDLGELDDAEVAHARVLRAARA